MGNWYRSLHIYLPVARIADLAIRHPFVGTRCIVEWVSVALVVTIARSKGCGFEPRDLKNHGQVFWVFYVEHL